MKDVDTGITFSPDATARMAYARWEDPEAGKYRLLSANLDGTDEKVLHIGPYLPGIGNVTWSPDGKQIACGPLRPEGATGEIDMFDVAASTLSALAETNDRRERGMLWTPDGRGIIERYTSHLHEGALIWQLGYVEYPAQKFHAITNDTNSYGAFSISADGKTLATINAQFSTEVDVMPGTGGEAVAVPGFPKSAAIAGAIWKSDGKSLIVASRDHLTAMAPYGSHATNLVNDPAAGIDAAALCGSGRYVFYTEHPATTAVGGIIWRANADGSGRRAFHARKKRFSSRRHTGWKVAVPHRQRELPSDARFGGRWRGRGTPRLRDSEFGDPAGGAVP